MTKNPTIQKRPVVKEMNGEHVIAIRDMVYLSISYDHRVIDGMMGGLALQAMVKYLESLNENNIEL